ncbi:hypothetical protein VDGE_10080 [Verticillium dahliae]|uniref:Spermine/spermidine synthase family protein n=1 Tax=Verticillium dahliae TaxID=27337 RepID=A0A444RLK1_VERDA|nr:hypothetical protein VDGE_10080 [Verticillium dahliae]
MASKRKTGKVDDLTPQPASPEQFENELKNLASKAQRDSGESWILKQLALYFKTTTLLILVATYSNVSYLTLSPVYGSIPSSVWHSKVIMGAAFAGWSGNIWLNRALPIKPAHLLPVIAMWIPTIQFFLFGWSNTFTAHYGPLVTELLTLFPLVAISAATVATMLEDADLSFLPQFFAEAGPGIASWLILKLFENLTDGVIQAFIGQAFFTTRIGLELLLGAAYALFAPSNLIVVSLPALYHTAMHNCHVMSPAATVGLNYTLQADNWILLDRKESLTGYISVIESLDKGFRVMRCDHSLLGGEWMKVRPTDPRVAEPIYGVFVMLEATRLVEVTAPIPDNEAKALVIGLGIGTTPAALVAHGIDTTVVEIDPVVHEFASKYFQLPKNHTAVIDDAVSYTASLVNDAEAQYDYIVHDVFTGGAEPIPLFTLEFLQGLSSLLKPDGVIAINYAGDVVHPAPRIIVNTIREVFPSCRIFRESAAPDEETLAKDKKDFTNMVIFCKKTSGDITFRRPTESDYLGSRSRRAYMMPQHEVLDANFKLGAEDGILRNNDTVKLAQWHQKSALGHWEVMRTVLDPKIWELW